MQDVQGLMAHIPVLLNAVLEALLPAGKPIERCIDGTLGAAGHSKALLDAGVGTLLGLDRDPQALAIAREALLPYGDRAHIVHASYAAMAREAAQIGWDGVNAILLDLGVSSMQLDTPTRGFAFRHAGPLDMRFDPSRDGLTASEIVNHWEQAELADLFYNYGEEQQSRRIAAAVVQGRPYETTQQLAAVIEQAVPRPTGKARRLAGGAVGIHPATRIFQALRIAVNDELQVIEQTLPVAIDLLRSCGRLAVISFHSLEDRIVKTAFKLASTDCICPPEVPVCVCNHRATVRLVTRKPMEADAEESAQNPRSRSAKLRVVEKL